MRLEKFAKNRGQLASCRFLHRFSFSQQKVEPSAATESFRWVGGHARLFQPVASISLARLDLQCFVSRRLTPLAESVGCGCRGISVPACGQPTCLTGSDSVPCCERLCDGGDAAQARVTGEGAGRKP